MTVSSMFQHKISERDNDLYIAAGPRTNTVRNVFAQFATRKKILDIGCADGTILAPFAQRHEIHGIDISEKFISKAKAAGVQAVVHDLEASPLPYSDKMFDLVFMGECIEHQIDTDWTLSEINRVTKAGGGVIITFPNIRTVLSLAMMLFLDLPPMYSARYRAPHYRDFTLKVIKMALHNNGFLVTRAIGCSFMLSNTLEFAPRWARFFPSWTSTSVVIASKIDDSSYVADKSIGEIY